MMLNLLGPVFKKMGLPKQPEGQTVTRLTACSFCGERNATAFAELSYWDLRDVRLVRCAKCELMQVDPMLSNDEMAKGCVALYRSQQASETEASLRHGYRRAFRKGVAFAMSLKLTGARPSRILEIGPGDGYFSRGVQYVFPQAKVVCLDIVPEVLDLIRQQHGFETILGTPETIQPEKLGDFDLVIARDILEHLERPDRALSLISQVTRPGGLFYFITPNGHQDIWAHYTRWRLEKTKSELLINHVNYFPPTSLRRKLEELKLKPIRWYIHNFRGTKRGVGSRLLPRLMAPPSTYRSALEAIEKNKTASSQGAALAAKDVLSIWPGFPVLRIVCALYALLLEVPFLRLNAQHGVGHEIFCVARKG